MRRICSEPTDMKRQSHVNRTRCCSCYGLQRESNSTYVSQEIFNAKVVVRMMEKRTHRFQCICPKLDQARQHVAQLGRSLNSMTSPTSPRLPRATFPMRLNRSTKMSRHARTHMPRFQSSRERNRAPLLPFGSWRECSLPRANIR